MEQIRKKPASLNLSDISVGDVFTFDHTFTRDDVLSYSNLIGDFNPIHVDESFHLVSHFKGNLIHGMLAASLFSTLVGMYCPGENSLYLSQTLKFKKPLFPNDQLAVKGTVIHKNESLKVLTIKTEIFRNGEVAVTGEAMAKMMEEPTT